MKIFKSVDVVIQLLTIVAGILYFLFTNKEEFFYAYFVTGGWQLFSCSIHGLFPQYYYPLKARNYYLISLAVVFIIGLTSLLGFLLGFLYFLLLFSPFMAIWYCYICFKEVKLYQ